MFAPCPALAPGRASHNLLYDGAPRAQPHTLFQPTRERVRYSCRRRLRASVGCLRLRASAALLCPWHPLAAASIQRASGRCSPSRQHGQRRGVHCELHSSLLSCRRPSSSVLACRARGLQRRQRHSVLQCVSLAYAAPSQQDAAPPSWLAQTSPLHRRQAS